MATLRAEICKIHSVKPHPGADRLEIVSVGGWDCIVPLGVHKPEEPVLYIPIDAALPDTLAEKIGVTKYLGRGNRVKAAKLRGQPSYGIVVKPETLGLSTVVGKDYTKKLGIVKWEPNRDIPQIPTIWTRLNKLRRFIKGSIYRLLGLQSKRETRRRSKRDQPQHPLFPIYTRIEHLRKNKDLLNGMEVIVTEKIHGTNSRTGLIKEGVEWKTVFGSHYSFNPGGPENKYYLPLTLEWVTNLLKFLSGKYPEAKNIILYGEIYGKGIQKLGYNSDQLAYRLIDIMIDFKYLSFLETLGLPILSSQDVVPILYKGTYDYDKVVELSKGRTTLNEAKHIREGVVVKPVSGEYHPRYGRLVFKHASDDYLCGNFDEPTDEEDIS